MRRTHNSIMGAHPDILKNSILGAHCFSLFVAVFHRVSSFLIVFNNCLPFVIICHRLFAVFHQFSTFFIVFCRFHHRQSTTVAISMARPESSGDEIKQNTGNLCPNFNLRSETIKAKATRTLFLISYFKCVLSRKDSRQATY